MSEDCIDCRLDCTTVCKHPRMSEKYYIVSESELNKLANSYYNTGYREGITGVADELSSPTEAAAICRIRSVPEWATHWYARHTGKPEQPRKWTTPIGQFEEIKR